MLQIFKKINWMLILWGLLILGGTALTIFGSAKFNDEWSKKVLYVNYTQYLTFY